jgi:hypothetical protein
MSSRSIVRPRVSRVIITALFAFVMIAVSLTAAPMKANAVTCYGDYCSGVDPESSGCSADAYTTTVNNDLNFGSLQERWSPTCQTNWTRLVVYPTGAACIYGGGLKAIQDTGYTQSTETTVLCNTYSSTSFWTPMIYSPVHHVRGSYQSDGLFTGTYYTPWA